MADWGARSRVAWERFSGVCVRCAIHKYSLVCRCSPAESWSRGSFTSSENAPKGRWRYDATGRVIWSKKRKSLNDSLPPPPQMFPDWCSCPCPVDRHRFSRRKRKRGMRTGSSWARRWCRYAAGGTIDLPLGRLLEGNSCRSVVRPLIVLQCWVQLCLRVFINCCLPVAIAVVCIR